MKSNNKLSTLLGNLEVPVQLMASDEGVLFVQTAHGLRTRKQLRAGDAGNGMNGEGTGGTDRIIGKPPRRR